jgi:oligopeptide transport system ATP-binding protein
MVLEASAGPATRAATDPVILRVEDVYKHFPIGGAVVRAVDGVSFEVRRGETLGLVGESGCGKSTLARLVTQLHPVTSGRVLFEGQDLARLSGSRLRRLRRQVQIIFQDPFASLDPRMTVGEIVAEPIDNFGIARGRARQERIQELLRLVGLNPNFTNRYPHEFSGGQRQRIGIARALAPNPTLIVCDEPVSALDVSIQAQIINLLQDLQREFHLTYLFIAHDLAVVRHLSDRVAVMYLGKVVEVADRKDIYDLPQHPYTRALLSSIPVPDPSVEGHREPILLQGEIPSPVNPPSGCRFHTRCPIARVPGVCSEVEPELEPHGSPGQRAACHFAGAEIG